VAVDVRSAADEVLGVVKKIADGKGLSLATLVDESAGTVIADRTAVRQVLSNLVENAVRHTTSGSVTVFAKRDGDGVWIGVNDTGPGIPAEHLSRIFERFYRVDAGRDRDSGGTGLGLAIVKHLAEAHGGRVTARSDPGSGTRIAAFFPDSPLHG
jgi:signal transduction histidine kinase